MRYNVLERTAENCDKSFCPFHVNHFRHLPNVVVLVWFKRMLGQLLTRFHFSLSALPRQPEEPEHGDRHAAQLRQARPARRLPRHHGARDGTQLRVAGECLHFAICMLAKYRIYLPSMRPFRLSQRFSNYEREARLHYPLGSVPRCTV